MTLSPARLARLRHPRAAAGLALALTLLAFASLEPASAFPVASLPALAARTPGQPTPAAPPPAAPALGAVTFDITRPVASAAANAPAPAAPGRLVIAIASDTAKLPPNTSLLDAPFWDDSQPMFALDVPANPTGQRMTLDSDTPALDVSTLRPDALPPGTYRAHARLILNRCSSNWRSCPGNFYSPEVAFTIKPGQITPVLLALTEITAAPTWQDTPGRVELVEVQSALLSTFHARKVTLRAGVVIPLNYDPTRQYAAIYEVPGFGGDHRSAKQRAASDASASPASSPRATLAREAFWIVLDPESPNGHTLFADSANNGPVGQALISELIPAIEKRYNLAPRPEARLLRGHSSGGWSTLWLALTYPQTFGAAWSTSPDPVDFRAFQLIDIYSATNIYSPDPAQPDFPSFRRNGKAVMTVRQENAGERMVGANQTSGMQWASWQAVIGSRSPDNHPVALFDSVTGDIDPTQLPRWRDFDIAERVRRAPQTMIPLLNDRVRLVCGDDDSFFLNLAVRLLQADVTRLKSDLVAAGKLDPSAPAQGFIKLIPGKDHSTIYGSPEVQDFPRQMLTHLKRHGLLTQP